MDEDVAFYRAKGGAAGFDAGARRFDRIAHAPALEQRQAEIEAAGHHRTLAAPGIEHARARKIAVEANGGGNLRTARGARDGDAGVIDSQGFALAVQRRVGPIARHQGFAQRVGRGGGGKSQREERGATEKMAHRQLSCEDQKVKT